MLRETYRAFGNIIGKTWMRGNCDNSTCFVLPVGTMYRHDEVLGFALALTAFF